MDRVKSAKSNRIVIVGGGAGGLELAVKLARGNNFDVWLVDSAATHIWKPRLHEMAAGARRRDLDEMVYADLAERWGFVFVQSELQDIDAHAKQLTLDASDASSQTTRQTLDYDILVLAVGGVTPDLSVDGVAEHAFVLDRAPDAQALFERLSQTADRVAADPNDNEIDVIIVGTGLTGVELAAYLTTEAQLAGADARETQPAIQVTLVEAADQLMPSMNDNERNAVRERLHDAGVRIRVGCPIRHVAADHVETESGERLKTDLTVWAAGRVGPPIADRIDALAVSDDRRWRVRHTLQSLAYDDIFAFGDCAVIDEANVPPTAQAASEQATHLARELSRYWKGQTPKPFEYQDKGTLMSLGSAGTVGRVYSQLSGDLQIRGRMALAAYRGLEREHEMIVLGKVDAGRRLVSDLMESSSGPRLKVH